MSSIFDTLVNDEVFRKQRELDYGSDSERKHLLRKNPPKHKEVILNQKLDLPEPIKESL